MRNFKVIGSMFIAGASLISTSALGQETLTGDQGLACEAILCLSSPSRPGECQPSLERYFGISFKRWSDTVQGRRDFLSMCPTSGPPAEGEAPKKDANLATLLDAISVGAGRCDSQYLNQYNTREIETRVQDVDGTWSTVTRTVVDNNKPYYCSQFQEHEYTYQLDNKYVGMPETGGFWADSKDYEIKLAEYNAAMRKGFGR